LIKKVHLYFVLLIALTLNLEKVSATHTSAAEITYVWASDSSYTFFATFYRYCGGFTIPAPSTIQVSFKSDSLNTGFSQTFIRMPISGSGVPPINPPNVFNCSGDSSLCVEEYVYTKTVTMPKKAMDWVASFNEWGSPNELDNLVQHAIYAECGLNNLDFNDTIHKNYSPIWHTRRTEATGIYGDTIINYPMWSVCEYRDYELDQNAVEYQNDSVVYHLIKYVADSFTDATHPVGYNSPYSDSLILPVDLSKPLSMDSTTGMVYYSPIQPYNITTIGNVHMFQMSIKAIEYRYDSFLVGSAMVWEARQIGYVTRTISIITTDSAECPDQFQAFGGPFSESSTIKFSCNSVDSVIDIDLNTGVECSSVDSNASLFELIDTTTKASIPLHSAWMDVCHNDGIGFKIKLKPDSVLPKGTYFLFFKQGTDSNTAITGCGAEIPPYRDTILITMDTVTRVLDSVAICNGDSILVGSNYLKSAGTYVDTLVTGSGCDSIVTTKVNLLYNTGFNVTFLCEGDSILLGGQYRTEQGQYVDTTASFSGCDSIITHFLLVQAINTDVNQSATQLMAVAFSAQYQWVNCSAGMSPIPGATSRTFSPPATGFYAVIVTQNGCSGTSDCVEFLKVDPPPPIGINPVMATELIRVYPNPANEVVNVFYENGVYENWTIEVRNFEGQLLIYEDVFNNREHQLKLGHRAPGLYHLTIKSEGVLEKRLFMIE
jgi:hypothetical protein